MDKTIKKKLRRDKIHRRIRATIRGTADRPRLSVYKSNKHVYAQLINDRMDQTLVAASSETNAVAENIEGKSKQEAAGVVGEHLAQMAKDRGITKAVFDRSGYKYHGVIKALAEGARDGGLDF